MFADELVKLMNEQVAVIMQIKGEGSLPQMNW